ncbi:MAG: hypothetical protein U0984_07895 [Prosthecobacter sp.]|nr:hypothetical protein [Prosthecobacter sp.]
MPITFTSYSLADPDAKLGREQYDELKSIPVDHLPSYADHIVRQAWSRFWEDKASLLKPAGRAALAAVLFLGLAQMLDTAGQKNLCEAAGVVGILCAAVALGSMANIGISASGHSRFVRHLKAYLRHQHAQATSARTYEEYSSRR